MYLEAGSASVFFSLDGTNADWHASIGRKKEGVQMTDREYSRLRASVQAVQTLDEDGRMASSRTRRAAKSSG